MQSLSRVNDGYKYLLTIVDTLSKKAWVRPLKDKRVTSVADAFEDVFQKSGRVPRKLSTDQGLEFRGRALQELLERYGVHYFTSNNETKEAVVEHCSHFLNMVKGVEPVPRCHDNQPRSHGYQPRFHGYRPRSMVTTVPTFQIW